MNNLRNKVQLIGHLGGAPIIKEFSSGNKLATISLATTETFYNKEGEKTKDTQWHNLVCWNKTAEIVEKYLDKGSEIAVEGKINYESWEDEQGNKKYATKIIVSDLLMLGGR